MKNKIQKFSKGDFQLIRPDVIFDETNLVTHDRGRGSIQGKFYNQDEQ